MTETKTDAEPKTKPGHSHDGPCITPRDVIGLLLHSLALRVMRTEVAVHLLRQQSQIVQRFEAAQVVGKLAERLAGLGAARPAGKATPRQAADAAEALTEMFAAIARAGSQKLERQPETGKDAIDRLRQRYADGRIAAGVDDIVD